MSESTLPLPQSGAHEAADVQRRSWTERVGEVISSRGLTLFWLGLILLIGASFRFVGLDWDAGQHLHPDERFLTWVVSDLRWPANFAEYIDESASPLNPRNVGHEFFVYGTLPTTIVKGVSLFLDRAAYEQVYLVGRALSGLFDLGSVVFLFLLARLLYRDDRVALLAAFLLSATVLAIQHSHFFVTDTFANFFVVGALYFLARVQYRGRVWEYIATGVFFGCAMASKASIFTFALVVALVSAYRVWQTWVQTSDGEQVLSDAERTFLRLALTALVAFVTFRIAQPDAFQGPGLLGIVPSERWMANVDEVRRLVAGDVDYPPGHQWTNRAAYLFPLKNMVLWGMGLPLGVAAWVGTAVAGWRMLSRREWAHLIPVTWIGILFLHQGSQFVKSLRYFLPIYPVLALMAAWLLIWLWDRAMGPPEVLRRRGLLAWTPRKASVLLSAVGVGTLLWALAFTSIYIRPHSRIQASRWIYDNIPPDSVLANEHWDDSLPLRIDGKDPFGSYGYTGVTMEWYAEDTPEKLDNALEWLDQTAYIILSSNRLYDSIPRLPMRYPMTVNYYDALFDGRLGFEKVAEFKSYPGLFGIEIADRGAEEAFSVYDHPRVQIFEKTAAYDREQARAILTEDVEWDQIRRLWPKEASRVPTALLIPEEALDEYRSAGTWSELFDRDGVVNRVPVLAWALMIQLLGLIAAPLLLVAGRRLPDRGYAFSKTLGLLLAGWLIWILASVGVLNFSRGAIWLVVLMLGLVALVLARFNWDAWRAFWARNRRVLLIEEIIFWAFFLLFLGIRWGNPDLWHPVLGGEKPMDFAYLNAIIKSPQFPPYDPWFAGGYINYYYFGFVLIATLIKALGIVPHVAYNLAIPTLFAMTAIGAFGAALALVHRNEWPEEQESDGDIGSDTLDHSRTRASVSSRDLGFGFLGALFVAVIGNLAELKLILDGFADMSTLAPESRLPGVTYLAQVVHGFVTGFLAGQPLPFRTEWWYWNATRVIDHPPEEAGPITELPWFSFLYADLHAHVMALPLTLLAVGLALAVLRSWRESVAGEALLLGILGLTVGALWPTNTWDFPAYAVLVLVALGLREWWRAGQLTFDSVLSAGWRWGVVLVLSYLLYQPFHRWYGSAYTSVERWSGSRTPLDDYLIIHGFFFFVIVAALLTDFWCGRGHNGVVRSLRAALRYWYRLGRLARLHRVLVRPGALYGLGLYAVAVLGLLGLALLVLGFGVPGLVIVLLTLTGMLALRRSPAPRWQMALAAIGLGLVLTLLVEVVVLKGDIARMNTVFKFYLQVWVLFGLAAAMGASLVWQNLRRWTPAWGMVWRWGFVLLFAATMLYPIFATRAKIDDRFDRSVGPTLDGTAFMQDAVYQSPWGEFPLVWDKQAIEWMQNTVEGSPVIAEASVPEYRWGNRYAMFTGLPAIVGWSWHQRQQRAVLSGDVVTERIGELDRVYNATEPNEAYRILRKYDVKYLIVGPLERAYYQLAGFTKFDEMDGILWDLVYENDEVRIYRVIE